jgi:hypothetical protein
VQFWLGTHRPHWLGLTSMPLMVSHRILRPRRSLPRAQGPWVLDSGAFSEIATHGQFTTTPAEYATAVRRYRDEIGRLEWAAPQDWMCEPFILAKTGLDVGAHQRRTIDSYLTLRTLDPALPFIPVLQGWAADDYRRHVDAYQHAGIDLATAPLIGLGSVCRRQATDTIAGLVAALQPLRLHGFGVKTDGLPRIGFGLTSADSLAWSFDARHAKPLHGCTHKTCANCLRYALWWRQRVLGRCTGHQQLILEGAA